MRRASARLLRSLACHGLRLFRVRDDSLRVARGFALGLAVNFIPTFGFGVVLSAFLARACGGNLLAGLAGGASLIAFWPFLFYLNLLTGTWLCRGEIQLTPASLGAGPMDAWLWGRAFTIGTAVNALLAGVLTYVIVRLAFDAFRRLGLRYWKSRLQDRFHRGRHPGQTAASRARI